MLPALQYVTSNLSGKSCPEHGLDSLPLFLLNHSTVLLIVETSKMADIFFTEIQAPTDLISKSRKNKVKDIDS